jgi:hypothetical protein
LPAGLGRDQRPPGLQIDALDPNNDGVDEIDPATLVI